MIINPNVTKNLIMDMKIRCVHLIIGIVLMSVTLACNGQTKQEKTDVIISQLNLVENQKVIYEYPA